MISYSEIEPTANIVNDEEQAVYHRMPWRRRNICVLEVKKINVIGLADSSLLQKPVNAELYSLKINLWIDKG
jgi:hypothetical protein